ncbi:glycosyl transferase [Flavobacterium enshiense DK69]|uniref:Beta-lactamase regulatory protein n=1 Tax=Flavobacterium enshiense DK69 TaxID=1107311 RepID=V6S6W2_9FLAO|nr:glycosyltransferase [Flavobacterium enshiense]ESU22443.1 glycosyl transferase [Flavobacterium enshiense DK69]KGO97446.1 beta-lactamase regulatory protein [Flavobacterium enshiense DK69]
MQNSPLVSILCLSYNHSQFVEEALNSVLNQTYKNIELLIADDCSPDNSKSVIENWLKNHPEVIFVSNPTNIGNTKTFNKLLALSKGEYIIDLAADDILLPDCIEKQLKAFQNSELGNVGIVYGNAESVSENGKHLSHYYETDNDGKIINPPPSGNIYLSVLGQYNKICSVSSMVKREVYEKLGGYDENLAYEDLDLWMRASRRYNFEFIPDVLVQKRELATSLGSQFFVKNNARTRKLNRSTYTIIQKALRQNTSKEENRALLKRIHFEMAKVFKTRDFSLLLHYILMELKIRLNI